MNKNSNTAASEDDAAKALATDIESLEGLRPGAGALAVLWWIGTFTLIFGVLLMVLAFRMRHWRSIAASAASTL